MNFLRTKVSFLCKEESEKEENNKKKLRRCFLRDKYKIMKIIKLVTNILLGFLSLISFIGTLIFAPWFQESSMEEKTDSKAITYFSKQTFNLNEETESDFSINMEGLHMVSLLFEESTR